MTKDYIKQKYEDELWSLPDFRKILEIDNKAILFFVQYYGFNKRTLQESNILISSSKYKKTCIKKYGVDNVSKLEKIKNDKKSTFNKNYGVDNIFKDDDFKKYIKDNNFAWLYDKSNNNRSKSQSKSIRFFWDNISDERKNEINQYKQLKYKEWWNNLSDKEKDEHLKKKCFCYISKLETRIASILINNNISYTAQYWVKQRSFDFRIGKTNILLEVQGDFWHGNPKKYKENDILNHPIKKVTAKELWLKDEKKRQIVEKCGFKVLYLWENEINSMDDIELYDCLINMLKNV